MTKHELQALIAYRIYEDMVEAGVADFSSSEGHWALAGGVIEWFEAPLEDRGWAWERKREDYGRFEDIYEQYKGENT